jgi:DNA invertase Pin-like site-specific DNA recombinase
MPIPLYPADKELQRQKDGFYAVFYFQPALADNRPHASLYLRVSSRKQSEEDRHSLPEQWRLNWEDAERRGYAVVAVYIDVLSGASRHRKGFQQMMAEGKAAKFKAIFATMNDRLFRSMWSAADIEELVEQHSIELFGSVEPIDKELLGLFAWVASRERRNIITRTKMGREAVARGNGIPSGRPPFYLIIIRNSEGKPDHIELHPDYAPIIKELCLRYIAGEPVRTIIRDLLKDVPRPSGRKTKYGWTLPYLNQILKSSTLYGKWAFKEHFIDVPAVIDKKTWDLVQLARKNRRTGPESGRPARIPAPLSKLLFCKVCEQAMTSHARDWDYQYKILADGTKARYRTNHGKPKIKYVCGGMHSYPDIYRCRKPEYVRNEMIFPKIWKKLHDGLAHPEQITVGIRKFVEQLENSDEHADLKTIEQRLGKIEQKMLSYAEQRAEKIITSEQHRELTTRLQDEKATLTEEKVRLASKAQRLQEAREMLAYVEPVARKMAEKMKDLTDEEKTIVIRAACRRIWLDGQNEIEIELYLPGLEALESNGLPGAPQSNTVSPLPESEPSAGSRAGESGKTNDSRRGGLSNKARCRRSTGCKRG